MNTIECKQVEKGAISALPQSKPGRESGEAPESLYDVPSAYITGTETRPYNLDAYYLSRFDMRCIFDELRAMIDDDSRGDIDGERYTAEHKVFSIEAVHRYRTHGERGGDSCCGIRESYAEVDEDRIEVVRVYDEDGREYPGYVSKLNACKL